MSSLKITRLVYENVAIGSMAQRIGECRFANAYSTGISQVVTQQIGHLEKRYRDSIVAVDNKIIAIEFKSPPLTN